MSVFDFFQRFGLLRCLTQMAVDLRWHVAPANGHMNTMGSRAINKRQKSHKSSLVCTPHKRIGAETILNSFFYDLLSRKRLAGLSVLLHIAKFILFYSCVLRVVWVV
jgi:hypothetical protein